MVGRGGKETWEDPAVNCHWMTESFLHTIQKNKHTRTHTHGQQLTNRKAKKKKIREQQASLSQ